MPAETEWIIQRSAADPTGGSLRETDPTSTSLRKADSKGRSRRLACRLAYKPDTQTVTLAG